MNSPSPPPSQPLVHTDSSGGLTWLRICLHHEPGSSSELSQMETRAEMEADGKTMVGITLGIKETGILLEQHFLPEKRVCWMCLILCYATKFYTKARKLFYFRHSGTEARAFPNTVCSGFMNFPEPGGPHQTLPSLLDLLYHFNQTPAITSGMSLPTQPHTKGGQSHGTAPCSTFVVSFGFHDSQEAGTLQPNRLLEPLTVLHKTQAPLTSSFSGMQ